MKKIYTLLAAACVTGSAFAAVPQQLSNVILPAQASQKIANIDLCRVELKDNGVDRAMKIKDSTGHEWSTVLFIQGEWGLQNSETGEMIDIKGYPFYCAVFAQQSRENEDNFMQYYISWPTYAAMDNNCFDEDGAFNAEKAQQIYGDKAWMPMQFEDFKKATGDEPLFTVTQPYFMPAIWGAEFLSAKMYEGNVINGQQVYPCAATYNQNTSQWDNRANAATWSWLEYDAATTDVSYDVQYKYTTSVGGNYAGAAGYQLAGSGVVLGFADVAFDTIGSVHIFNGGRQEQDDDFTLNYDIAMDGALNYYYLCFCDNTMAYEAVNSETQEEVSVYTDETLPVWNKKFGCPGYNISGGPDYHFTFAAGAIWAPENAEPYGLWTMKTPSDDGKQFLQGPEAYNLVIHDKSSAGDQDGFYGLYEGYTQVALPGQTFVGIGDKKRGMNFRYSSGMMFGHYFIGSYTGNILYHGTPNKWMDITNIPACTENGDFNAIDADPSSVEGVESDAPVVSATYYNFQGQRLSSEPESGLYIIRAVKADGTVKATKVAK